MTYHEKHVGIGQLAIAHAPDHLTCLGLGSCVAVILYDPTARMGGIVHVLLPKAPIPCESEEKYADTGVRKLVREMKLWGSRKENLVAKLVGGAHMFPNLNISITNIGYENYRLARAMLRDEGIRIVAEDLAGVNGRSAYLDCSTGKVTVKTAFAPLRVI